LLCKIAHRTTSDAEKVLRARTGAVAVAYGEHLAAAAGPADEREAAYRASVDQLTSAWKENPEFGNAVHEATVLGRTEPLKEYLASDKPLCDLWPICHSNP
jgi:hypothetical protein